ncbi:M24 family metallopeptidase [Gimesia aquarii]|uniref:Putative peptidase n=1 Tax=Gimesia aquarii TaxID=2527964 RepID=A0A517WYC1_9PLAN|nr:M24 family metallopeptidase [Gimesia aquarii]QDU10244.1 putative peptidase [Gimesia aquarii]
MTIVAVNAHAPISSGEIPTTDPRRALDVDQKQQQVVELLEKNQLDALLLQAPDNIAWFTGGADLTRPGSVESIAAVFVTTDARLVACNNVDADQIFDRAIPGLGFQVKSRPWYEPLSKLINDLCKGRKVASDTGVDQTLNISEQLKSLRFPFTELEGEHIREVGKLVAHAVEATARSVERGATEQEIAGSLSHRLLKRGVTPKRLQVMADGQCIRYRHWGFGEDRLERYCIISAVGSLNGLHAAATRTVALGKPPSSFIKSHHLALLMQATGMYFSKPDWALFDTWKRVKRIYEKYDCPDEWQHADQADIIGYLPAETSILLNSEFKLKTGTAAFWHPSVGPAMTGDTILVEEDNTILITPMEQWPTAKIMVKEHQIALPDILILPD